MEKNHAEDVQQVAPVMVVEEKSGNYVLIDGYHRVRCLERIGRETVWAEIWSCTRGEGLTIFLAKLGGRKWEALEEGFLVKELLESQNLTKADLAAQIGKSVGWVSNRLKLVNELPEEGHEALKAGKISAWTATRVITPLAKANPDHARRVIENGAKARMSCRQWEQWFKKYRSSNIETREHLVNHPDLYIAAVGKKSQEKEAKELAQGPEGAWARECRWISNSLNKLHRILPDLVAGKTPDHVNQLLVDIHMLQQRMNSLKEKLFRSSKHDTATQARTHICPSQTGPIHSPDKQGDEGCQKHHQTATEPASHLKRDEKASVTGKTRRSDSPDVCTMPRQRSARARSLGPQSSNQHPLQHLDAAVARGSPSRSQKAGR